jgi:hypothetical protein
LSNGRRLEQKEELLLHLPPAADYLVSAIHWGLRIGQVAETKIGNIEITYQTALP